MSAAVSKTTAHRQELQARIREQEVFEFALREQVESNRDLLAIVEHEVHHNIRLRERAGREFGTYPSIGS